MEVRNTFIEQAARDYDMTYDEVEHIHRLHLDTFYEELEIFIKNRSEQKIQETNEELIGMAKPLSRLYKKP